MTSKESAFASFTPEQAAAYASARCESFPRPIYHQILESHIGAHDARMDVGTGPGKVVFDLLPHFRFEYVCDVSSQTIEEAKKGAKTLGVSSKVRFEVSNAESRADTLPGARVDLITIAMVSVMTFQRLRGVHIH